MRHSTRTVLTLLHRAALQTAVAAGCAGMLGGCSLAPKYAKPEVESSATYKESAPAQSGETNEWKLAEPKDDKIRGRWWEIFHEPELNALEGRATASNQVVAVALAKFFAARAVVKQSRAQYFPTVGAGPAVTGSRGPSLMAPTVPVTGAEYSLLVDASWEPDLWGRIRNTVAANSLEAQATLADLGSVRLTVQAEVASDFFEIRVLDAQMRLLHTMELAYREWLGLTTIQQKSGLAAGQEIALAETQLELLRAQATDLGVLRAQLEHAIAALLGQPASSFAIATNALTAIPVVAPTGVPSQLLERRPDIAAAERRVAEANAQIGVARAAYYPTLTLSGGAGFQGASVKDIFTGPGFVWSVGVSLAQTLFDGGLRNAVTAQARAVYQGTVANYRQTVLTAFQEVEDNLSTLRILGLELRQQNAAVESSRRYLKLAVTRHEAGLDDYLAVIAAQITLATNERTALDLQMKERVASVQLIKTLGGGWDGMKNMP